MQLDMTISDSRKKSALEKQVFSNLIFLLFVETAVPHAVTLPAFD